MVPYTNTYKSMVLSSYSIAILPDTSNRRRSVQEETGPKEKKHPIDLKMILIVTSASA